MRGFALVVLAVVGCHSPKTEAGVEAGASAAEVAVAEAAAPDPGALVLGTLTRWNEAHNAHDAKALAGLYAAHVSFYGTELSNERCVSTKRAAFTAQPDYAQTVRDIDVKPSGAGGTIVRFVKTSTSRGRATDYPSYLIVLKDLRIAEESDDVTDRNLRAKAAKIRKAAGGVTTCEDALGAIVVWTEEHYPAFTKYPNVFGTDNAMASGNMVNPGDTEYCNTLRETIVDDPKTGEAHSVRLYTMCVDFATGRTTGEGVLMGDPDGSLDPIELDVGQARRADVGRLCGAKH
jgi:hypothetical protein